MGASILSRFIDRLISLRFLLLLVCIVITAVAFKPSLQLDFDRTIESMFQPDDPRYKNYEEDKDLYGSLETSAVAYEDPNLLTIEGLKSLEQFAADLKDVEGVQSVFSLADARRPSALMETRSLPEQLEAGDVTTEKLREELLSTKLYRGRFLSDDGQTTVLLVNLAPVEKDNPAERRNAIPEIRRISSEHNPPAVVAGGPVLVDDVFRHLEEDGRTLGIASSLILMLVIAILFRNLRWIVLPLAVVHVTLVWTKAFLVISNIQMSMVSSPLVALVTVIGVATVVHITIRFREERDQHPPVEALRQTFLHVLPAIFWTCMTTAAGFGALLASSVVPVQSFGTMMAIGSAFVLLAAVGLTPGVVMIGRVWMDPARPPGEEKVAGVLRRMIGGVERHPWLVAAAGIGMVGLTSLGIFRLQVATDFNENFRESSPIVESYQFLADRIDVVGTIDVLVNVPDADSPEFNEALIQLEALQKELEKEPGVKDTLSMVQLADFVADSLGPLGAILPRNKLLDQLANFPDVGGLVAGFWNRKENNARILLQIGEVKGADAKRHLVENIERISQEHFPATETAPAARAAGVYILLTYVVESFLADQWVTFGLAIVLIYLMMTVAFRSWKLGFVALLPNIAPILIVIGTMGWVGLKINIATAMLGSISMGLAVDFSIHYLYRFQHERRSGKNFYDCLRDAHGSVGLAMVLANLALVAGFTALVVSSFVPTVHFGILVSVAMLGGLTSNLIVLPLMLRVVYRSESRQAAAADA